MLEQINNLMVAAMDIVLGWMLHLPGDVTLFLVAILTSAILTFVRLISTDQAWLKRAAADHRRLKELIREAKIRGDREAVARHKSVATLLKMRSLKFEFKPLLIALVPILLLATWCFARLGYHPPVAGQTVEIRAYVAKSAVGRPIHLVPQEGLTAETGWTQRVVEDEPSPPEGTWDAANVRITNLLGMTPPREAVARWRLKTPDKPGRYGLQVRYGGRTYEKELLVGLPEHPPAVEFFGDAPVRAVEVVMQPRRLFGVIGGLDFLYFPPWLVAYLLIAIPFVTILKRACRIA